MTPLSSKDIGVSHLAMVNGFGEDAGMLSMIEEIIRDLLIFVAVTFALFIVVLVVVSKMPDDNPLKRILTALSYRVGMRLIRLA
jgi:hypothetical protein